MAKRADNAAEGLAAINCCPTGADTIGMGLRLSSMLGRQIEMLEKEPDGNLFSEERVKSLLTLAKAVQAMESLGCNAQDSRESDLDGPHDIMEFRRQLEEKIDALGAAAPDAETAETAESG